VGTDNGPRGEGVGGGGLSGPPGVMLQTERPLFSLLAGETGDAATLGY